MQLMLQFSWINCSSELDFEVEIGDERFSDSKIDLFAIAEQERSKASYNYPVTVSVQNHRYTLGQIIFSEMFIRMPVFTSDEQFIYRAIFQRRTRQYENHSRSRSRDLRFHRAQNQDIFHREGLRRI